jgi:starch synthase
VKDKAPLRICLATSEIAPLAKTGGLADVSAALSAFLHRRGHDVRVLMPRYSVIDTQALDIEAVDALQNLSFRFGAREIACSVDAATLPGTALRIHLLRCEELYGRAAIYTTDADEHLRFALLSRAAIEMCQRQQFAPDIFHCHDWHTALIPLYLKSRYAWDRLFAATRTVLTIHNIGYQGIFGAAIAKELGFDGALHHLDPQDLARDQVNFLRTGALHADFLTTVSPTYAQEIQGEEYGMGLQDVLRSRRDRLVGILNGVNYKEWNPATDPLIPRTYSRTRLAGKKACKRTLLEELGMDIAIEQPLVGMVTRLTPQKGIDLVQAAIPALLRERPFGLVVLGNGESRYEAFFDGVQRTFPGRVSFRRGFDNRLAHRIEAGSDLFLMPSRYEPCGLNQMYSLRYGTVPVVRQTGGLADSVQMFDPATGSGTGIVFRDYDEPGLRWALTTAFDLHAEPHAWRRIMDNGMAANFSWERQGQLYVDLFRRLAARGDRNGGAGLSGTP